MNPVFRLLAPPAVEPVSLDEAMAHLKVETHDDDDLITTLVKAVRAAVEEELSRGLITQTWQYAQDDWSDEIWLPRAAPLQSVTWVKYYDASGVLQTLSPNVYVVQALSDPAKVSRAPGQSWPALQARSGAVSVQYVVGWTAAAQVPDPIKWAILLKVGLLYAHREDLIGGFGDAARELGAAAALLAPFRVWWRPPC